MIVKIIATRRSLNVQCTLGRGVGGAGGRVGGGGGGRGCSTSGKCRLQAPGSLTEPDLQPTCKYKYF